MEIEHHKTIVHHVNNDIALRNYQKLFVLAIESIQGKAMLM